MKGALLFIAIFALSMLVIPMIAIGGRPGEPADSPASIAEAVSSSREAAPPALPEESEQSVQDTLGAPQEPPEYPEEPAPATPEALGATESEYPEILGVREFLVLDETTGEIHTVPVGDYIRGAVAAEMPPTFHTEALKAQAVAAHTYALYHHMLQQESPDPALKGADFTADPSNMKVYVTQETARAFYGDKADAYWEKVCAAADSVAELVLAYDGEPIVAAYHSMSAGVTEDAANVWTGSAPYLLPAGSEGDLLAPDYETELSFTYAEIQSLFLAAYPDMDFSGDSGEWFNSIRRSSSGYVTSIEVGGVPLHGSDVRRVLELRSHNFEILPIDTGFLFVVCGYGHGVGLSQYGADFMARQGADCEEILMNYYSGVTLARAVLQ